ncbi:MAG: 50S ribosomal protein L3 N(5)-glutamine methyltransferase [Cellvibrionaceae bacterium]
MTDSYDWPAKPCALRQLLSAAEGNFNRAALYFGHGTDNAWDEAVLLALHGLGLPWADDAGILERRLSSEELANIVALFERRISERLPAAYLVGKAFFAGLEFRVTPEVLIPRSPIAELIDNAYTPWLPREPARVLDLCTGCGCIGIATAMIFPGASVDLSDISTAAVEVAEHNIRTFNLRHRVRAVTGDLFSAVSGERYDLIVCNPPYVDSEDLAAMPAEYRAEPELALASGNDGLDFCRRLLREAREHLTDQGSLIVEVGNSWEALEKAYPRVPFLWIEFARGGHGVFVLSAAELECHADQFL